jgi:2-keto-4-pentenoate hydratase
MRSPVRSTHAGIEDCASKLSTFSVALSRDARQEVTGGGADVLGSPLLAFAHLADVLAAQSRFAPVQAGEIITTGTLTAPLSIQPGELYRAVVDRIDLPALSLTIA